MLERPNLVTRILTTPDHFLGQRYHQFLPGTVSGVQDVALNSIKSNKLLETQTILSH